MYIKQLKIHNFRGIRNLTIDFDTENPHVFIGVNGIGKSSILDCITILLSWYINRLQNPRSYGSFFNELDIFNGESETYNEITLIENQDQIKWLLTGVIKSKKKTINSNFNQLNPTIDKIHNNLETDPNYPLPLFVYYPTNRAVLDIPLGRKKAHLFERFDAYDDCLSGVDFRLFFEWFRQREDLEIQRIRFNNREYRDKQIEAVRQAITKIIPEFSKFRVKRSPLQMVLEKNQEELIINQLSDGEKCLLAMVGDIARRLAMLNPNSDKPLEGKGLILIDEIELHLHPQWQRNIIPRLRETFPNCQLIVTTHSPQVISHVKSVYLLDKTDQGIEVDKYQTYGKDSNQILELLMETGERPKDIKEKINKVFRLIEQGNLQEAKELKEKLANEMATEEPILLKANMLIKHQEILKK